MNVYCLNEPIATDTIYSDTLAIDDGYTWAQLFVWTKSLGLYLYGMKKNKWFVNTSEGNIYASGAMSNLISYNSQYEVRNYVQSIHREIFIGH